MLVTGILFQQVTKMHFSVSFGELFSTKTDRKQLKTGFAYQILLTSYVLAFDMEAKLSLKVSGKSIWKIEIAAETFYVSIPENINLVVPFTWKKNNRCTKKINKLYEPEIFLRIGMQSRRKRQRS